MYGSAYEVEPLPAGLAGEELRAYASRMSWYHEIDLGGGVMTPAMKPRTAIDSEWSLFALGDLRGRTVLDVGGVDGAYAFLAEQAGAARAAVLDHYVWAAHPDEYGDIYRREVAAGRTPPAPHESSAWHPEELPAKWRFDTARQALNSNVEAIVADFSTCDLEAVGIWDVVLFLGVIYHLEDPLRALRRLLRITGEQALIETEAMVIPGSPEPLWRFFPSGELNHDRSNWWVPNIAGLVGALQAAGFAAVDVLAGEPEADAPRHYRAVVRARR